MATTLKATMPNGRICTRRTDRDYKFVVTGNWDPAKYSDCTGEAFVVSWHRDEHAARNGARVAISRGLQNVKIQPVDVN